MAVTAVISAVEDCVAAKQNVRIKLVITNTGGADIVLLQAPAITLSPSSASGLLSRPELMPSSQTTIAASNGTLTMFFDVVPFANVQPGQTCTTIGVQAEVTTTGPVVTRSSVIQITAVPQTEPQIYLPRIGIGSLRFDSQNQSENFPACF